MGYEAHPRYSNIDTYKNTLQLLEQEPEIIDLLKRIIQWEEEMVGSPSYDIGFRSEDVFADPRKLAKLVPRGILRLSYKSSNDTRYRAYNLEELKRAVEDWERGRALAKAPEEAEEIPDDLFKYVIGHDDVKDILWRSIKSEKPVHVLLFGAPASAKSLILEDLIRLPRSRLVLGSGLSKAGLYDIIFEEQPRYLIIDELDKIDDTDNLACLLSLMERGVVVEAKHRKHRSIRLSCTVYAGANKIDRIPPELLSRFVTLRFMPYTAEEYIDVVVHVLVEREKVPQQLALYIAHKTCLELGTRDPRDAVKVSRLMKEHTKDEVDRIISILKSRR